MLEYKTPALEDRDWVEPIFKACNRRGNEYTFANLFNWAEPLNIKIAKFEDNIMFKHMAKCSTYSCPIGSGNLTDAIKLIMDEAHSYDEKLKLVNLDEFDVEVLNESFPGQFRIEEVRDNFDYIYVASDLGNLKGRKHHVKRNHMNKFMKTYPDWRYVPISKDNIDDVRCMAEKWYSEAAETKEDSVMEEKLAVMKGLDNYFLLGLQGGIIYVGDEIAAFSFGSEACADTLVVHCEKAFTKFDGAYTMIAKEFANAASMEYKYVNREDDMGIEGLRVSKLSYRPEFFYKRFEAFEV